MKKTFLLNNIIVIIYALTTLCHCPELSRIQSLLLSSHIFLGPLIYFSLLLCLATTPCINSILVFILCWTGYWEPAMSLMVCQSLFICLLLSVGDVQDSMKTFHFKCV